MRRSLFFWCAVSLAVLLVGCQGRRGERRAPSDSGEVMPDAAAADDGGPGIEDGGPGADGSSGADAGPDPVPPDRDIAGGGWYGTWEMSDLTDLATASFTREGILVSGTISLSASPCLSEATVDGTLVGYDFQGTFSSTTDTATFDLTVNSTTIIGTFTFTAGACSGRTGILDMSR